VALDGVRLRPRVDCALDAGHGWVPCVINIAGLKLDLNYLPAGVVDVRTNDEAFATTVIAMLDSDDITGDDLF